MSLHHGEHALSLRNVSLVYDNRTLVHDLNLNVTKGQIAAIVGPSGAGKTTTLKLITGLSKASQGTVELLGKNICSSSPSAMNELRRKIGILFQQGGLQPQLNVFDNVAFPLLYHFNLNQKELESRVMETLNFVGLKGAADLMPDQLSGGMSRRVALSRALIMSPELLVYDEPFVGQDPISTQVLVELIRKMNQPSVTSVIVSHDIDIVLSLADVIFFLAEGTIIASGTPDEISKSDHPWIRQFLDGNIDGPMPFHYSGKISEEFLDE